MQILTQGLVGPEMLHFSPAPRRCPCCWSLANTLVARDYKTHAFPLKHAEQAPVSTWLKIKRKIQWFLPFPNTHHLVYLKVIPLNPFLFSIFSFPFFFPVWQGLRRHSVFFGRLGNGRLGFPVLTLIVCRRSKWTAFSVLQLGEQEPIYTRKTKKQAVRILDFLFLCLFFYKYPPVLSGAWIWSHCANFLLVPRALIKITHPETLPELTFMWFSSE
jgi:hypothetical protein